ncbi:MAG: hypothetical protein ACRC6H_03770 [Culicoidibacterales bacterium]
METDRYLQRYLTDVLFSQAVVAGYEISSFEMEHLLHEKGACSLSKAQFVQQLQQAWHYVMTANDSVITMKDLQTLLAILTLDAENERKKLEEWEGLLDKWQRMTSPFERALTIGCDCVRENPNNVTMTLLGLLLANKVLFAHDLAILSIEPTKQNLKQFITARESNQRAELSRFFVESCLHNYELDTMRKILKTHRLDEQLVKQIVLFKELSYN